MPIQVSYPGVYIEELPTNAQTVTSASTSVTLFADFFPQGPMGVPVMVESWAEFMRQYGGLDQRSEASYGIYQYFNNGGQKAWVVRLGNGSAKAAQYKVDVPLPPLSTFTKETEKLATQAQNAAKTALKALTNPDPATAAIDAGYATEAAAKATALAADASKAVGEELTAMVEQYNAKYGPEAGAALDAARAAAQAAQDAADAAFLTSTEAKTAAGLDLTTPPTNATTAAAGGQVSDLIGAASKGVGTSASAGAWKQVVAAQKLATTAQTTAGADTEKYGELLVPLANFVDEGTRAQDLIAGLGAALQNAATFATGAAKTPPTESILDTNLAIEAAAGEASDLLSALNAWLVEGQALVEDYPVLAGSGDLKIGAINTAIQAIQGPIVVAVGDAQAALSAGKWWTESQSEDDLRTDAGAISTAQQAQAVLTQAISSGGQLQAQGLSDGSATALAKEVSQLQGALTALEGIVGDLQSGKTIPAKSLASNLSLLKAQVTALAATTAIPTTVPAQVTAGNFSGAELLLDWYSENIGSYLGVQLVADLLTAVRPLDAAMDTATLALEAAQAAAAEAEIAMKKAQLAILAGLEDEADSEQSLVIAAANPGVWGNSLQFELIKAPKNQFNLNVREMALRNGNLVTVAHESYTGLTLTNDTAPNYAPAEVNEKSKLIQLTYTGLNVPGTQPTPMEEFTDLSGGRDGGPPQAQDLFPVTEGTGGGLPAAVLAMKPNIFNILCLPVIATYSSGAMSTAVDDAIKLAAENRAFYIVDIPSGVNSVTAMESWMNLFGNAANYNAAVYYPRLLVPDPLSSYRNRNVGSSGTLAGIYATNDLNYGVWKAPAGTLSVIQNAELAAQVTDEDDGKLNPLGINALRNFKTYGNIVWGARTLAGADLLSSEWKYINVRRLADYIEDSLYQSLKWAVFQDNDDRLWAQISTEVGSFMSSLFAAGAFQGTSASQAYMVKCDSSTTTATDIEKGIVNVLVGFAPVKPAEFVIVQIQQLAGQSQAS